MSRSAPPDDVNTQIDVMVLYTTAAGDFAGAGAGITATINEAISDTNQSYEDSEVQQRIRLVHVQPVAYTEKADIGQDWWALVNSSDDPDLNRVTE